MELLLIKLDRLLKYIQPRSVRPTIKRFIRQGEMTLPDQLPQEMADRYNKYWFRNSDFPADVWRIW